MKIRARGKHALFAIFIVSGVSWGISVFAEEPGEAIFKKTCIVCHTVGKGKLVGPDLAGVHKRHSEDWILKFVKSSQTVINQGDPEAKALFEQFNKMVMPDQALTDEQIKAVLSYIKDRGLGDQASSPSKVEAPISALSLEENIAIGQDLFQGKIRLAKGGPACNSCHDVKNDAVIGGGILAKDLTSVFSRMGTPGVKAILAGPPFPVMQQAYKEKALQEDEIQALAAFLEYADAQHFYQRPRDYGVGLFYSGVTGLVVLFGFYSLIFFRRKKRSVNQHIFDRQIKSE